MVLSFLSWEADFSFDFADPGAGPGFLPARCGPVAEPPLLPLAGQLAARPGTQASPLWDPRRGLVSPWAVALRVLARFYFLDALPACPLGGRVRAGAPDQASPQVEPVLPQAARGPRVSPRGPLRGLVSQLPVALV